MKTLEDVIEFLEDHVIECDIEDGCERCLEARAAVEVLKDIKLKTADYSKTHSLYTYKT